MYHNDTFWTEQTEKNSDYCFYLLQFIYILLIWIFMSQIRSTHPEDIGRSEICYHASYLH